MKNLRRYTIVFKYNKSDRPNGSIEGQQDSKKENKNKDKKEKTTTATSTKTPTRITIQGKKNNTYKI